jgi:hypothetical protein
MVGVELIWFLVLWLAGATVILYLGYAWGSIRATALIRQQIEQWQHEQQWTQWHDEISDEVSGEWTAIW